MTYYYVHDESSCALQSDDPPAIVCQEPYVECVTRDIYLRACKEYGQTPEPHPDPCLETRRRIRVAVAAWAYEVHADPIMSDDEFDALALSIDLARSTKRSDMDDWFIQNFNPSTGVWVLKHPEPEGLERIYRLLRSIKRITMPKAALILWTMAP